MVAVTLELVEATEVLRRCRLVLGLMAQPQVQPVAEAMLRSVRAWPALTAAVAGARADR